MTIFYTDDDADEIDLFCEAIATLEEEITCITANSGEEAMALLQQIEPPQFIFLDLHMPRMNGKECLIKIKNNPLLRQIPVIIYSSLCSENQARELLSLGAHKFLKKQCSIDDLAKALHEIITRPILQPLRQY